MTETKISKHKATGNVYGPELATPMGQFTFLYLTKKRPPSEDFPDAEARHEACLLLDKQAPAVKAFRKKVAGIVEEMLVEFNKGRKSKISIDPKEVFNDGDAMDQERYPECEDKWMLNGRRTKKVRVVAYPDNSKEISAATVKSGMHGKFVIVPLITGHGVSYQLYVVQPIKDTGERFGGVVDEEGLKNLLADAEEEVDDDEAVSVVEAEDETEDDEDEDDRPKKKAKSKAKSSKSSDDDDDDDDSEDDDEEEEAPKKKGKGKPAPKSKGKKKPVDDDEDEEEEDDEDEEAEPPKKKGKGKPAAKAKGKRVAELDDDVEVDDDDEEEEDDEEEDDEPPKKKGKGKPAAKAKGKGKKADRDEIDELLDGDDVDF